MNVKGVEISEAQVEAISASMTKRFRASDVIAAAEAAGVPVGEIAMRTADRIIQRQRRAQQIRIIASGPYWEPTSTTSRSA